LSNTANFIKLRLWRIAVALLAVAALLMAMASGASALSLGLQWSGDLNETISSPNLERVQGSGATMYRVTVDRSVTSKEGWTKYETLFKTAAERGITILPVLMDTTSGSAYPGPAQFEAWGKWVKEVVGKFGTGGSFWIGKAKTKPVQTWEVWNEPNLPLYSPVNPVSGQLYGEFFVYTVDRIREVRADAQALVGGLYVLREEGSKYKEFENFITGLYAAPGFSSRIGGLGIHPYGFSPGNQFEDVKERVEKARTVLNSKAGGTSQPLWITEVGWPVKDNGTEGKAVTPQVQSELLKKSFDWVKEKTVTYKIDGLFWHAISDRPGAEFEKIWDFNCGLIDRSGKFRNSWWTFQQETGAPVWPTGSLSYDSLGGGLVGDPTISSQGPGQLNVFARGSDNALWHNWFSGTSWSGWQSLGGGILSGPGSVSWSPNRIDVVARGGDNGVWHWAWNGSGWSVDSLGGQTESAPEISSQGPGQLDVFIRGLDNQLWHKWYSGGGWSGWQAIGGTLQGGPGAVSWGPNRIDVVARGTKNDVWHWAWNGVGWSTESLGGSVGSDPDISALAPGYLDVFAKGLDNALWVDSYSGFWGGWHFIGDGPLISGPGAVSWSNTRTDIVALKNDSSVRHFFWNP
jgi:hypothetical protein